MKDRAVGVPEDRVVGVPEQHGDQDGQDEDRVVEVPEDRVLSESQNNMETKMDSVMPDLGFCEVHDGERVRESEEHVSCESTIKAVF
jgi:hypothetical protein